MLGRKGNARPGITAWLDRSILTVTLSGSGGWEKVDTYNISKALDINMIRYMSGSTFT